MILTYQVAQQIIKSILTELEKRKVHAAIAVADSHGELMAFLRMEEVKLHSITIAANKAWTAARTRKATSELGKAIKDSAKGFDISFYGDPKYTGFGGGVPIFYEGKVIGAVAVSGLTQDEDEEVALVGLKGISF
ncbi:MAG TPA: heme-binding protein [Cytophagaceae bacterium]|jgi:glc operon protein GlcG|nr:heme-binding protein [Cytophagaceae bacterium]